MQAVLIGHEAPMARFCGLGLGQCSAENQVCRANSGSQESPGIFCNVHFDLAVMVNAPDGKLPLARLGALWIQLLCFFQVSQITVQRVCALRD